MKSEPLAWLLGGSAALLVGLAKTGIPGAGIPAVAMMAEAYPGETKLSVGAILPLLIVGDLFAIAYYRRHADWARLLQLIPFVVAGMVPGYLVLWLADGPALRILIGVIILLLLGVQLGRRRYGWERLADHKWFVAITGVLAGFATTVSNAAGPVMSIYLVSNRLDKMQFMGTSAWFFFFMNVSKIPLYTLLGMMTSETLHFNLLLLPGVLLGAAVGIGIIRIVRQSVFEALVLILAAIAAVRMLMA